MKSTSTLYSLVVLVGSVIACRTDEQHRNYSKDFSIDTAHISILPTIDWAFESGKPGQLTSQDYQVIEQLVTECITDYNARVKKHVEKIKGNDPKPSKAIDVSNYVINLKDYKRQYVVAVNSNGEKEVWVNCFCHTGEDNWRKTIVFVHDGGKCFFNLKINVTTKKYYDFIVNEDT